MRSLDTNVLVRYLTADEPRQLAAAERVIEEEAAAGEPIFLTAIVLCELVWVLSKVYEQGKAQVVRTLEAILTTEQFRLEHDALVRRAVAAWRGGKGNFADYLIGEIGREAGCRDTVTFDRALKTHQGFTVLP